MPSELIAAAIGLADPLEAENMALAALDLRRAAGMVVAKTAAVEAFRAARERTGAARLSRQEGEAVARKLDAAAAANRRLLGRAITVQGRVLEMIARAARTQTAPPQYGRRGRLAPASRASAITLSASA